MHKNLSKYLIYYYLEKNKRKCLVIEKVLNAVQRLRPQLRKMDSNFSWTNGNHEQVIELL